MAEKTMTERVRNTFYEAFGDDWRKELKLHIRADHLSWFVYLIEKGIAKAKEEFRADKKMNLAEAAASLGSWTMDLESLVEQIEAAVQTAKPKPKR